MSLLNKICRITNEEFIITEREEELCNLFDVPLPTVCPEERLRRRLYERNSRKLYWRKCDHSGKKILSQYDNSVDFPVYDQNIWWGEDWDASEHGRDFDFSRPFFEQFKELKNKVPHMSVFIVGGTLENSDYTNCTGYLKNCYLIFESDYNEECYYSNLLKKCKNVVDCSISYENELCYECIDCNESYNLRYSQNSKNCQDSYFLFDCQNCKNCIACVNQRQKKYMLFNKQYSKEDFLFLKDHYKLDTHSGVNKLREEFDDFKKIQIHRALYEENNETCLGDHLYNSKNSFHCFDSKDLEDCIHCAKVSLGVKSCMDYNSWGDKAELVYSSAACGSNIYNLKFCTTCTSNVSNLEYCDSCVSSSDLFGCVGLNRKKYCILNKEYSKEEYLKLKEKIINHMKETKEYGEFFPNDICSFGYNETLAMDSHPLSKQEALALGYKWKEEEDKEFTKQNIKIENSIKNVNKNIIDEVLECEVTGKNYKIIPQELDFYKKLEIPIPRTCPDERHRQRIKKRTPYQLNNIKCASTGEAVYTTYPNLKNLKIYSKDAYFKHIY